MVPALAVDDEEIERDNEQTDNRINATPIIARANDNLNQ